MTKKAFIIHGFEGLPEHGWYPWLKSELEKRSFQAYNLAMPDTLHPKMIPWVNYLTEVVGTPDKDCYFVGHSLGCITILRYLENLEPDQKIGGSVLVAGFASNIGYDELDSFFRKPINWNKVKSHCNKFVAIHSDNDPYVPLDCGYLLREKLNAELIIETGMKHFTDDDGINELPAALNSLLKIS